MSGLTEVSNNIRQTENGLTPSVVTAITKQIRSDSHTAPSLSNWRAAEFYEIINLIEEMSRFDPKDDFFVDSAIKDRAITILAYLKDFHSIEFPKVLPEGSDSLTFTWDMRPLKNFLTIYQSEIENTVYNKLTGIRCLQTFGEEKGLDFNQISNALALIPNSSTVDAT